MVLSALLAATVALVVAVMLTPLVRRVAHAVGAVDVPGGRRVHAAATPRLGGAAVLVAYLAGLGIPTAVGVFHYESISTFGTTLVGYLAGGCFIAAIGAIDDIRPLGAKRKLLAQIAAASCGWWFGARIEHLDFPVIGAFQLHPLASYLISIAWVVAFINAINLIDGLDGLASGVVFFAALTNTVVAFISGNLIAATLNAALGGAVLGFLFFNFNPATIFLGDTGSMFLGYALGMSALLSGRQKESTLVSLLVPIITLGLPLTDTLFAMVRRFLSKRPIFSADRGHIHHRLLDLGLTQRRAVLLLHGTTLLLCLAAIAAAFGKDWQVGAALAGAVFTLAGVGRFAGYFEIALLRNAQRQQLLSAATEALRRALPRFFRDVDDATTAPGVWAALEKLVDSGYFESAEYVASGETKPVWRWEAGERNAKRTGKLIESEFSVRLFPGAAPGTLRFVCVSDEANLAPQVEILLQLVADGIEAAVTRMHVENPATLLRAVASNASS